MNSKTPPEKMCAKPTTTKKEEKKSLKFKTKEQVLYRAEGKSNVKWMRATVVEPLSPCRYKIRLLTNQTIRICHGDQLRPFNLGEHAVEFCVITTHQNDEKQSTNIRMTKKRLQQTLQQEHREKSKIK